jgi:ubiquinone/menaquinone biosynthesis C-methylase UbiE
VDTYTARIPAVKARQIYVADFADVNIGLEGKLLCDIGAGEGQFLEIVSGPDYRANVFGIEPSEKNCSMLSKNNFPNFNGTIEDYSKSELFNEQKFDVITIMWTLVNCRSCVDMVSIAYKMLKPGGSLVLAEGSRILVPFKNPLNYYFNSMPQDLHCFHFSANALKNLLKISGFEVLKENRYLDSDILCVIGRKIEGEVSQPFERDNYLEVYNFFKRWHVETQIYYIEV